MVTAITVKGRMGENNENQISVPLSQRRGAVFRTRRAAVVLFAGRSPRGDRSIADRVGRTVLHTSEIGGLTGL